AAHKSIAKSAVGSREDRDLLASVHLARHQPASGTRWAFVDPDALYNCGLEDEWFFALSGQLSLTGGYGEWNDFPCRYGLGDAATATYIVNTFRDPVSARIHLFVPASLAQAITSLNQAWSSPGVLHILQSP
ncbi:MAG TPA: hypothetical protein VKR22_11130, partial [Acidimicrobiales bacterium]|nr:hypothetical protein [Acidimicrobiales bacterium]